MGGTEGSCCFEHTFLVSHPSSFVFYSGYAVLRSEFWPRCWAALTGLGQLGLAWHLCKQLSSLWLLLGTCALERWC